MIITWQEQGEAGAAAAAAAAATRVPPQPLPEIVPWYVHFACVCLVVFPFQKKCPKRLGSCIIIMVIISCLLGGYLHGFESGCAGWVFSATLKRGLLGAGERG